MSRLLNLDIGSVEIYSVPMTPGFTTLLAYAVHLLLFAPQ